MKKHKWYSILLAGLTLVLTTSCVTREYEVTETYYETEMRQEAYTVTEEYEIRTSHTTSLYKDKMLIGYYRLTGFLFHLGEDEVTCSVIQPVYSPGLRALTEAVLQKGMSPAGSVVWYWVKTPLFWNTLKLPDVTFTHDEVVCKYILEYLERNNLNKKKENLSYTDGHAGHMITVHVGDGQSSVVSMYRVLECSRNVFKGEHICPVKSISGEDAEFSLAEMFEVGNYAIVAIGYPRHGTFHTVSIDRVWDDIKVETRQVTKYRDVPVQVEKQRTVTETKQVPFWEPVLEK